MIGSQMLGETLEKYIECSREEHYLFSSGPMLLDLPARLLGNPRCKRVFNLSMLEGHLRLAQVFFHFDLQIDDGLQFFKGEEERVHERLLRDLLGFALDHDDGVLACNHDDVELALF